MKGLCYIGLSTEGPKFNRGVKLEHWLQLKKVVFSRTSYGNVIVIWLDLPCEIEIQICTTGRTWGILGWVLRVQNFLFLGLIENVKKKLFRISFESHMNLHHYHVEIQACTNCEFPLLMTVERKFVGMRIQTFNHYGD